MNLDLEAINRTFEVRDAKGRLVIIPSYTVAFYLAAARGAGALEELLVAAGRMLSPHLSHVIYRSEAGWREWNSEKYSEQIHAWCQAPKPDKTYHVNATGAGDKGASPAGLWAEFDLQARVSRRLQPRAKFERECRVLAELFEKEVAAGKMSQERARAQLGELRGMYGAAAAGHVIPATIRDALISIELPLTLFSSAAEFREWVLARAASASDALISAHAGVGLRWWMDPHDLSYTMNRYSLERLAAMLLRCPVLDWEDTSVSRPARPIDPKEGSGEQYFKRGRWLSIVSRGVLDRAGGIESVGKALDAHAAVKVGSVGANCAIMAGDSPDPTGDNGVLLLDACRHVNRLMRPAQIKSYKGPLGAPPDFSEAFLSLA